MKTLLFTLTAVLLMYSISSAAVYYVDNLGNDSNTGLSESSPWKTISKVNSTHFYSGDKILFKRGCTWYETITVSYDNISFGAYGTGSLPVIDAQMTRTYNIYIYGRANVVIENFSLTNQAGSGSVRIRYSNNVTVRNCEIYVTAHGGVFLENSRNCTVSGNRITTPDFIDDQTDGIYSQRNNGNIYENNNIVISNTADLQHNDGIQCYLDTSITARGNYIEQRNFKTGNAQGLYATDNFGCHIWYNNVINTPNIMANSMGFKNVDPGYYGTVQVYFNTVITKGGNALCVLAAPDFIAKNNVFISNGSAAIITVTGTINNFANLNNNLYYGGSSTQIVAYLSVYGGNNTLQQLRSRGSEAQGLFGNPQLDVNYVPVSGSPALDKGLNLSSPYNVDKAGTQRPQGTCSDIGALEKAVNTILPPQAPVITALAVSVSAINLSWNDVSGETGYTVQRFNGSWSSIANLNAGAVSFADTGLQASTKYIYRLRAFNSAGESFSDTASAVTFTPPPPPPPTTPLDTTIAAMDGILTGGGLTTVPGSTSPQVVYLNSRKGSLVIRINLAVQTACNVKGEFFYSAPLGAFQVQVDNGTRYTFSSSKVLDQWYWGNAVSLGVLSAGQHTITFTNNRPGPGAVIDLIRIFSNTSAASVTDEIPPEALQNYPNPFNPETTIRFNLSQSEKTEIRVYDILGNLVKELSNEVMPAGVHEITFNASGLASGIYILQMRTESEVRTLKLNFLK